MSPCGVWKRGDAALPWLVVVSVISIVWSPEDVAMPGAAGIVPEDTPKDVEEDIVDLNALAQAIGLLRLITCREVDGSATL